MRDLRLLPLLPCLLAGPAAFAEPAAVPGVPGASFVQGLLGLIFVIGLLVLAAWLMKRLGAGGSFGNGTGMRVVSGLAVGPRERILLLEVGETWVVVGVTASQMRTLHTMPKGALPTATPTGPQPAFAAWLKHFSAHKTDAS